MLRAAPRGGGARAPRRPRADQSTLTRPPNAEGSSRSDTGSDSAKGQTSLHTWGDLLGSATKVGLLGYRPWTLQAWPQDHPALRMSGQSRCTDRAPRGQPVGETRPEPRL